jgi:hypothetical protein
MPSTDSDGSDTPSGPATDGGEPLTERQVYDAVHHAVRDALWDVLGTVVLTLFLLFLLASGFSIVLSALTAPGAATLPAAVFGTALTGLGTFGLLRLYDYL